MVTKLSNTKTTKRSKGPQGKNLRDWLTSYKKLQFLTHPKPGLGVETRENWERENERKCSIHSNRMKDNKDQAK